MKKVLSVLIALCMLLMASTLPVFAEELLTEGVTVARDELSPTGYTVTFVYKNEDAASVMLASDTMTFHTIAEGSAVSYTPYEWTKEMFPGNTGTYKADMTNVGDGLWTISLPLPSGAYGYYFLVEEEACYDPTNPPVKNEITGVECRFSMVYVPFDAERQLDDRSYELPRTDGQTGVIEFATYEDANGETRSLAIYLPYGYDPDRAEPYKVLYLSHGGGGMELEWMNEGCVPSITDNLVAEGKVEPFVTVTMQHINGFNIFDPSAESNQVTVQNQVDKIMPLIESQYNVSTEASGRAYAGLSMGGCITTRMYYNLASDFGYFGIWSAADGSLDLNQFENLNLPKLMLGGGTWDFGFVATGVGAEHMCVSDLMLVLAAHGISFSVESVPGCHDWSVWPRLFKIFAEDYLWQ